MHSLADLYYHMLQDVLHAEKQVLKLLPKLARKVSSDELKTMLTEDREAITDRIAAVEAGFEGLGQRAKTVSCEAMKGLVGEAEEVLEEADETALDAGVLAAVQAIKHYEITRFGTLSSWAMQTGKSEAQAQFQTCADACRTLDEELTRLAEADVNVDADAAESEDVETKSDKSAASKGKGKASAKA